MESLRPFLFIGLALVSFLLWTNYQKANAPKTYDEVSAEQIQNANNEDLSEYLDTAPTGDNSSSQQDEDFTVEETDNFLVNEETQQQTGKRIISVETDVLSLKIDKKGGDIIEAKLIDYPITQGEDDAYELLSPKSSTRHIAQSFLLASKNAGPDKSTVDRATYTTTADSFTLTNDELNVSLKWVSPNGVAVEKVFSFKRGSHSIDVIYKVNNQSADNLNFRVMSRLEQTTKEREGSSMFMPVYRGTAYSTQDDNYKKLSFPDIQDENLRETTKAGWIAMLEHYFVAAWVPPQDQENVITAKISGSNANISVTGQVQSIAAGASGQFENVLYVGPKDQDVLESLAENLNLTVDFGPLFMISQVLFDLLKFIQSFVGNWGVAIILITLLVKSAMYFLTKKQYESMAKMRNLQPKMAQLKDRFGDDRQKMSKAMMDLYKKEKVNPMGGCFPLLLQMPIFLALYWVLLESVELRHAGFMLWITDLSVPDPFFVLPILTGVSMFLLQRLQPMTIQDPMQQKIMQYMPVAMSLFFFLFPAGLVLYWLVSNLVTLVQAKMIYASMEKRGIKTK